MKCNSLVYLKQVMKFNRRKKMQKMNINQEEEKEKELKSGKPTGLVKKSPTELKTEPPAGESSLIEVVDSQINDNMSMMCPICHFFMYKSVCTTCGHMFCQYCLDEYLVFKDSCPLCEKSIRRGKITR